MDHWGTILLGWAVALGVPALYAAWILLRARVLARQLHLGEPPRTQEPSPAGERDASGGFPPALRR